MKLILTDVDGVLLEWVQSFQTWIRTNHPELQLNPDWRALYTIHDWYGLEMMGGHDLVYEFNNSEAIKNMLPYGDAPDYVVRLANAGYDFIAITSMGAKEEAIEWRKQNLKAWFGGAITRLIVTPLHDDKSEYLQEFQPAIWIEDKPGNAEVGFKLGHRTYLMSHGHNGNHFTSMGITRVDGWKEIYDSIMAENHGTVQMAIPAWENA